jgi:hypothetical protein
MSEVSHYQKYKDTMVHNLKEWRRKNPERYAENIRRNNEKARLRRAEYKKMKAMLAELHLSALQ